MTVAGIVAEYNPFHNGHKYHIEETRRRTGADFIIAAISGNFVQRGAPTLLDKFLRTKMALENGADLVLELPVTTALSSAEGFATGGVCLFEKLGVVDYLSFGCESIENSILREPKFENQSTLFHGESKRESSCFHCGRETLPSNTDCAISELHVLFQQVAKLLAEEPPTYRTKLQSYLKTGMSFPKARQLAALNFLHFENEAPPATGNPFSKTYAITKNEQSLYGQNDTRDSSTSEIPNYDFNESLSETTPTFTNAKQKAITDLLSLPNNTLGLEYQKAIYRHHCHLKTCMIPRYGNGYSDPSLSGEMCSAAAIREALLTNLLHTSSVFSNNQESVSPARHPQNKTIPNNASHGKYTAPIGKPQYSTITSRNISTSAQSSVLECLRPYVPASVLAALTESYRVNAMLTENDFSDLLCYALLKNRSHLEDYALSNSNLTDRISHLLEQFENVQQFTALLKSKNQTYTALSRSLFRILLGITGDDLALAAGCQFAPYVRVLGFRKSAAPLLKEINAKCTLPIIRHPAKDCSALNANARHLFELDLFASDLYRRVLYTHTGSLPKSELRQPLIVL